MSFVSSMFGPQYSANVGQPIQRAVDVAGAAKAYTGVEDALKNQQNFVNALGASNGVGNLSNTYNQLQGVANGTGPNPAKAMLAQTTGQNVANTGALMAGQRGAGANPGLIARQAAQAGAGIQQNAAGQGATLQANQSLNALGQMGGIAGQQVAAQQAATQGLTGASTQNYGQLLNAIQGYNQTQASLQENVNTAASQQQAANNSNAMKGIGGLANAAGGIPGMFSGGSAGGGGGAGGLMGGSGPGSTMTSAFLAEGGEVGAPTSGPVSMFGRAIKGSSPQPFGSPGPESTMAPMAKGGKVAAIVSPGERYIPPAQARQVAKGEKKATEVGQVIKGKASVKGDSYKNDTVKKSLSPGGVVVPRTKNTGDDVAEKATAFVRAVLAKGGHRG